VLAQGADRLLPAFHEDLSAYSKEALEKLGVEVILSKIVAVNGNDGVTIDEENIPSSTVIWAAGVYVPRVCMLPKRFTPNLVPEKPRVLSSTATKVTSPLSGAIQQW